MSNLHVVNGEGKYHDDLARETVIQYIFQPSKAIHGYIGASEHVSLERAAEDMTAVAKKFQKDSGIRLRHFVLSFHPTELDIPKIANDIGTDIVAYLGEEYQAVYAVHENRNHIHIHIVVNTISHLDGHRYRGNKKELYSFIAVLKLIVRQFHIKTVRYIAKKKS